MDPSQQQTPGPTSPKAIRAAVLLGSAITIVWLAVIGNDTLDAYQKGATAKMIFGLVLIVAELASFTYIMLRTLNHPGTQDPKAHKIAHWVMMAAAFYFLFAWKA